MSDAPTIRLPTDALVVLAGPSGSGKSTWAAEQFRPGQVVSSDELRSVVGTHTQDLRASADAFDILDRIVDARLARGLLTVIDTLGMDAERIERWLAMAAAADRPAQLVRFDETPATCRKRNAARAGGVPSKVLTAQLKKWEDVADDIASRFGVVHPPGPVHIVGRSLLAARPHDSATTLRFGLLVSRFESDNAAVRMGEIAAEAEAAGFDHVWVMDHFVQIPQVGREWDPMLESTTALGWLAARTETIGVGALVNGITHRNLGVLGHALATLDVLSGGRARCGLGVGWFAREHRSIGLELPPVGERYELLEDALEYLPVLWGPGAPAYEGRRFSTPEAIGYPRPVQDRIPILVGGSGPKRTLRLAAAHADACNLFGEPDQVRALVDTLHRHCDDLGRDPSEVEVTQLSNVLAGSNRADLDARLATLTTTTAEDAIDRTNAGTHEAHIDRFGRLGDAGVQTVIVSLADVASTDSVASFAPIIEAFRE